MIKAVTINISGKESEKTNLPEKLFGIKVDSRLLSQAMRVYLFNQRQSPAKTKTRGEVAKTTAKMYRQKGTGRARHGSYSAPIFVGGGISHGPSGEQNFKLKMSSTLGRQALIGGLTKKATENSVVVLSDADSASGKTQQAKDVLAKAENRGSTLVVATKKQDKLLRAFKNLAKVTVIRPNQVNVYEIMVNKNLFITREAIAEMEKMYVN